MVIPFLTAMLVLMWHNGYMYKNLRVCQRGISNGNSEVGKEATNFGKAKTSNFLYTMLYVGFLNSFFFLN